MKIAEICRANVNMFEKYNVDKYLGCICMSVAPQYQGLSIGQRLLEARYVYSLSNQDFQLIIKS